MDGKSICRSLIAGLLWAGFLPTCLYALTPAGTVISVQGKATYFDVASGAPTVASSNAVIFSVQQSGGVHISAAASGFSPPGQYVQFPHRITNTGNGRDTFFLSISSRGSLALHNLAIFDDPNGNGKVDSGEVPVTVFPEMERGHVRTVVISVQVPPTATIGQTATLYMEARSKWDPSKSVFAEDLVEVKNDIVINASLAAVPVAPLAAGEAMTYTLTAFNSGIPEAHPVTTTVFFGASGGTGGVPIEMQGILLSFPIPANTVFENAQVQTPEGALQVYHINGQWTDAVPPKHKAHVRAAGMILSTNGGKLFPSQAAILAVSARVLTQVSKTVISAIGSVAYQNTQAENQSVSTNEVLHTITGPSASAAFTDATGEKARVYHTRDTIYVTVADASMNVNPAVAETVGPLIVTSTLSGDRESLYVVESGENTGRFQGRFLSGQTASADSPGVLIWRTAPAPPLTSKTGRQSLAIPLVKPDNGVLDVLQNSLLQLEFSTPREKLILKDHVIIDPSGVVFNSITNTPIRGAKVTLVHAETDQPVTLTSGVNPMITGEDGRYTFEAPSDAQYRLKVESLPTGFSFPSNVPFSQMTAAGRTLDKIASYGGNFTLTSDVVFDLPVDPDSPVLFIQKSTNKKSAEIGDSITYTVTLKNKSAILPVENIRLVDQPPLGISYLPKTLQCTPPGGTTPQPLADPADGDPIVFGGCGRPISDRLGINEEMTLTYKAIVGPGALLSDGVNKISATGSSLLGPTTSNVASAAVKIVPGVFTDRAIVIGKVFIDMNENGEQDSGDPGVPGIRLVLEDGTWAMTDVSGQYTLYGITPETHVLRVDPMTLPRRFILTDSSSRFAGSTRTRFVDPMPGELHKANFTIAPLPREIWAPIIEARRTNLKNQDELTYTLLSANREPLGKGQEGALPPASGMLLMGPGPSELKSPTEGGNVATPSPKTADTEADPVDASERLKKIVAEAQPGLAIVEPAHRAVIPIPVTSIVVTGHAHHDVKLTVNNQPVPDHHVGGIVVSKDNGQAALEWIAVPLKIGQNMIKVQGYDPFGNLRAEAVRILFVPGAPEKMEITANPKALPADGTSAAMLTLRLFDRDALPVLTRSFVTITTNAGTFLGNDLDPNTPGFQLAVEGGEMRLQLIASERVEDAIITAKLGGDPIPVLTVPFLPPLRDMLVAGVLDGAINLRTLKGKIMPVDPQDRFEDGFSRDGRAAFYLKGKVKGDTLLTLAYDSDKKEDQLFRDIQPDAFYPIYGDSSIKGFDAQSTERLYLKLEKGKSYLLFGDYTPGITEKELVNYQRSLSGLKYHFEDKEAAFTAFHNQSKQRQVVERIRANGTSGFYQLTQIPIVENSDIVEILTVDREQPEIVLKQEPQARFTDYTLESLTGRILFKSPVASFDRNLNPIFIKITYETLGGIAFDTYGIDGKIKLSDRFQVGGTAIQSNEPGNRLTLYGVDARTAIAEGVYATGEIAGSDSILRGVPADGMGLKAAVSGKRKGFDFNTYWLKTDPTFQNPSANITGGKMESGIRINAIVRAGTVVGGETISSSNTQTGMQRSSTAIRVEQALKHAKGEVGLKHIEDRFPISQGTQEVTTDTARIKLLAPFPGVPQLTTLAEYERALNQGADIITLGGDFQVNAKLKMYAKQEWISGASDLGRIGIGQANASSGGRRALSLIGMDTSAMPGTTAFSEYRIANAISGREDQAAVGLRTRYAVSPGVTVMSTFEQTTVLSGPGQDSLALSAGIEHLARPNLKGSTRVETRDATTVNSYLWTGAMAYRLTDGVSLLTRETLYREEGKSNKWSSRFLTGAAIRPVTMDWVHVLSKYEFKYESDTGLSRIHVGSVESNARVAPRTILFLKYASRIVQEEGNFHSDTHMVEGRVTYDLTAKVDIGVDGRSIVQSKSNSQLWGYGVEGGYNVARNLWLSLGYQINGLDQDQLTNGDAAASGFYMRLRYKFDEEILGLLRNGLVTLKGSRPGENVP